MLITECSEFWKFRLYSFKISNNVTDKVDDNKFTHMFLSSSIRVNKYKEIYMSDQKYTKADLLWESTRRNQDFRNYYSSLKRYMDEYNQRKLTDIPSNARKLLRPLTKWAIRIMFTSNEPLLPRLLELLNPLNEIDHIRDKIISGTPIYKVHPYAYIDELEQMESDNFYHRTMFDEFGSLFIEKRVDGVDYICINKQLIGNNIILLLPPTSKEAIIVRKIKEIRKLILTQIKDEVNSLKVNGELICYPRDINDYIGWLNKYDEVVNYLESLKDDELLQYDDGAVVLPNKFPFKKLVPIDTPADQFEGKKKAYIDAYKGAVKLIKTSPYITFSGHVQYCL